MLINLKKLLLQKENTKTEILKLKRNCNHSNVMIYVIQQVENDCKGRQVGNAIHAH